MDKYSLPRPERESYVKHRRDVNRQIIFPIILVSVVGIGLAIFSGFAASAQNPGVSLWADISMIWLIIPMMALALVIMALMIALVYGLNRLLKISPHYTGLAQSYALWFSAQVVIWTDKLMDPVMSIKTWLGLILKHEE
jgi:hypothetical protein